MNFQPTLQLDAYKTFHPVAYHPDVTHAHINFTNRHGKYSNVKGNKVIFAGLQYFMLSVLIDQWNKEFFELTEEQAVKHYARVISAMLGKKVSVEHLRKLHKLGYLPIEIKAVEEGTLVPYGVPSLTITTTVAGFGWVPNMLETVLSAELWGICTSATTAFEYRKRFEEVPALQESGMIPFMGHDFSYRGMFGTQAAAMSGFGHLCSFFGSDTIPAALFAEQYYGARIDEEMVFASVEATEHSVETSNTLRMFNILRKDPELSHRTEEECMIEAEVRVLKEMLTKTVPTGILSYVSDGFDFWAVVTEMLPRLYSNIMGRDGTLVVRPDSGDPVEVLCGKGRKDNNGIYYPLENWKGDALVSLDNPIPPHEGKGLVECLWDTFGGTKTKEGLKLLDSHIGAIYGDSITLERQDKIINKLLEKGFVPSVVLGIGSFTYQYVTRDTHGSVVKATDIQMGEGNHLAIYKDPKTDASKKSAKGLLMVVEQDGELVLEENVTPAQESSDENMLKTVFKNGVLMKKTSLNQIREKINENFK